MENRNAENERKTLYCLGWLLLLLGSAYLAASKIWGISVSPFLLPCVFHTVTGFYCPGCGGTRAVRLLLEGHILESLYYHPFVLYGAVLYVWFLFSNTVEYVSRGRFRIGMRYRKRWVVLAVLILAVNFIIKNGVLLFWHYPMIP